MLVTGKEKANIVKRTFFGKITEEMPASILQTHPNLILLLDGDVAGELSEEERLIERYWYKQVIETNGVNLE